MCRQRELPSRAAGGAKGTTDARQGGMKVPTIVALVLIVATSIPISPATAQPREESGGRVPYGPKLKRPPPPPPPRDGDWVRLATPSPTRFGTEWIVLDPATSAFRTLRIAATSGTVHLRRVRVEFTDGKVATFHVNQRLTARKPNARIDLGAPRRIERLAVTTARTPEGMYVVYGASRLAPAGDLIAGR